MATDWTVKELLAAVKMNQLGVPKYTAAEAVAILDLSRAAGMINYNTENKTVQIYQSGNGSVFDITRLSNLLHRDATNIGITTPKAVTHDESFVNVRGLMNTSLFVTMEYLQETSIAGEIEIIVTDGVSPITNTDTLSSDGAPVKKYIEYTIDTTSFAEDDVLQVTIGLTQVSVAMVELRGI